MAKKKILQTLLTTASGLAVMTGLAGDALGASRTTSAVAGNKPITTGAPVAFDGAPVNGDDFIINVASAGAQNIIFDGAGGANSFREVNLNGRVSSTLTVAENVTLGAIGNAADVANRATVVVADGKSLTLKGDRNNVVVAVDDLEVKQFNLGVGSTVDFSYASNAAANYDGEFRNGAGAAADNIEATLTLTKGLVARHASVTTVKTIAIAAGETLEIDPAVSSSVNLLSDAGGHAITFADAASGLSLKSTGGRNNTFILKNHLDSGAANRGVITITATGNDGTPAPGPNYSSLTLKVDDPAVFKAFGDDAVGGTGNHFKSISFVGDANSSIEVGRGIKVGGLQTVNVENDSGNVTVKDISFAAVKDITIKNDAKLTFDFSDELDATAAGVNLDVNLNTDGGGKIAFTNADSRLVLKNAAAAAGGENDNMVFKLDNNIVPDAAADDFGIIELSNQTAGTGLLTLQANGAGQRNLGETKRLSQLVISGNKPVLINSEAAGGTSNGITVTGVNDITINPGATLVYGNNINGVDANGSTALGNAAVTVGTNAGGLATLILDVEPANIVLADKFDLDHPDSIMQFGYGPVNQSADKTVDITAFNFYPKTADRGVIIFDQHDAGGGFNLTLTGANRIGDPGGDKWKEIRTRGTVIFNDNVTGVGTNKLTVETGSLTIKSNNSLNGNHVIGTAGAAAELRFELKNGLQNMGAGTTKFAHENSVISLSRGNVGIDAGSAIILGRVIKGNINGVDRDAAGIVEISNLYANTAQIHSIAPNATETLGTAAARLKELNISAVAGVGVNSFGIPIFVKTTNIGRGRVIFEGALAAGNDGVMNLNDANSAVTFTGAGHNIPTVNLTNAGATLAIGDGATANSALTGNLQFTAAAGVTLNKGTLTGNIGATGAGNNAGNVIIAGANNASTITGNVFANSLQFNNADADGNVTGDVTADVTFNNATGRGTIGGNVTGDLTFTAADNIGRVNGNLTGNVNFNNLDATFEFAGERLTGDIISGAAAPNTKGKIKFLRTASPSTVVGNIARDLTQFEIGDGATSAKLELSQNLTLDNSIKLYGTSELIIGNGVTALTVGDNALASGKAIRPNNDGDGVVRFQNTNALTVTGSVGTNADAVNELIFENGGEVTFDSANFNVNRITFNPQGDDGVRVNVGNSDINGVAFANLKPDITENVISTTKNIVNITTAFGTANNSVGSIELASPAAQTLNIDTSNFYGGIITNQNGVDTLSVNKTLTNFARIGSAGRKFNTTNINENTTVIGDIYSNSVNVAAGKKLEVRGSTLDMSTLLLKGVANNIQAQALISGATDINFDIRTSTGETGNVDFRGAKNINKSIGASGSRLNTLCFDAGAKDNVVRFANQGLFAKSVKFNNGTYQLANDMEVDGGLAVQGGSVLNLGTSKLTVKNGTSSFQGAVEIRTTLNADASGIGRIVADVGTGNELSLASLESLVVTVDDTSVAPSNNSQSYDFITLSSGTNSGADKVQSFTIGNQDTAFSKWTIDNSANPNTIRLVRTNQTSVGLSKSFENVGAGSVPQEFLNFINDVDSQSVAAIFATQLSGMDDENRVNAVERVTNPGGQAAQESINNLTTTTVAAGIANRVATFIANNPIPVSDNGMPIGVAAGDNPDRYGAWFSPFFEDARQKKRSSTAGYKSESVGATVGFDVKANEEIIVGAAATYVNTDVKYKDFKRGDKTRIESLLGSLYGMWQLDNYYLQGSATFGTSKVNNTELRRVSNTSLQAARGKNTSMSFSGELTGGYNFVVNNQFALTPHAGFGIVKINDSSYKESGVVGQSLDINKKSSAKVNLILGLRATASPYHFNGMEITPEAHAVVRHDLRGDQSKIEASLDRGIAGQSNVLSKKAPKTNKTFYNLGFGVNAEYNGYDYGFTYDANIASKYVAHQGSLKVRVNF